MWFNRHTADRNDSGEQKVNFESPVPFSKCLRAKIYCNMNVHFDPQGCQTLLLKESEPFLLSLGSWTICVKLQQHRSINEGARAMTMFFLKLATVTLTLALEPSNSKLFKILSY